MNKRQALEQGLNFTGIYDSYKEEVKVKISKERKLRPKARIVLIKEEGGYSGYADSKYFAYETIKKTDFIINNYDDNIKRIKAEYEKNITEAGEKLTYAIELKSKAIKEINIK